MTASPSDPTPSAPGGLPDVIAPGLHVLFCGINPSIYSATAGHHFARPGNRFWRALHEGGFTSRVLTPREDRSLLVLGYGLTNVVPRPTVAAAEIGRAEFEAGGRLLVEKLDAYRPQWLVVLGVTAYRTAFGRPEARVGPQEERIGPSRVWVLPNPSGLNAHYPPRRLAAAFRALFEAVHGSSAPPSTTPTSTL